MKIGFSGTREGMSFHQQSEFAIWVKENEEIITEFHHGMCVGADYEAHDIVRLAAPDVKIVGHPAFPEGHPMRAIGLDVNEVKSLVEPMVRNRHIADESDMMFFAPVFPETRRSGTWATFRYARKRKYPVVMLARGTFENPEGKQA
jgi:hypothetical protein